MSADFIIILTLMRQRAELKMSPVPSLNSHEVPWQLEYQSVWGPIARFASQALGEGENIGSDDTFGRRFHTNVARRSSWCWIQKFVLSNVIVTHLVRGCDRMSSSWGHFGAFWPPQAPFTAHSSVTSIFRSGVAMGEGLQGGGL